MASGEYRKQWHKYLPLAFLNYTTSYDTNVGCEPTRVFHGRIPYNKVNHKKVLNSDPILKVTTDFADNLLKRK